MNIEKDLRALIKKISEKDIDSLPLDAIILDATPIDSLDMIECMLALEDHFKIELDDISVKKVQTLNHLIYLIEEKLKEKGDANGL